jgi:cysteine desulfurase
MGWEGQAAIEKATQKMAKSICADANEIIFTSGATESNNLFIIGAAIKARNKNRKKIIVSAIEHKSVLDAAFYAADLFEFEIKVIPVDNLGIIDFDFLQSAIDENVLLVSVASVNNEIGTIQNIKKISLLCKEYGALLHSDSVHLALSSDINVEELGVDAISISAHKIYGPKGIGVLYLNKRAQSRISPLFSGGGQQNGLRPGTLPVSLCVGIGEAISLLVGTTTAQERQHIRQMRDRLISGFRSFYPTLRVNGAGGDLGHPGNANICFVGLDAHALLGSLQPRLAASTGSACTSGQIGVSHVLSAIGLSELEAQSCIRFSIGRFTTDGDIDRALELVADAVNQVIALACVTRH